MSAVLKMVAAFGCRDMKAAFSSVNLSIPVGVEPFIVHTAVHFLIGMSVVTLFAILSLVLPPTQAVLIAAGFAWLLGATSGRDHGVGPLLMVVGRRDVGLERG